MLTIFPAKTDEDLKIAKGLLEEYLASLFELDGPVHIKEVEKHKHQMNNLGEYFRPPDGCLLLAKYGEETAGCVGLEKLNDSICQMKRLYVRSELRGLKIGRELAERVIEQGRRIGYERMRIHTLKRMKEGYELYKSLGFQDIAPYRP